jgi:hypothetical protein
MKFKNPINITGFLFLCLLFFTSKINAESEVKTGGLPLADFSVQPIYVNGLFDMPQKEYIEKIITFLPDHYCYYDSGCYGRNSRNTGIIPFAKLLYTLLNKNYINFYRSPNEKVVYGGNFKYDELYIDYDEKDDKELVSLSYAETGKRYTIILFNKFFTMDINNQAIQIVHAVVHLTDFNFSKNERDVTALSYMIKDVLDIDKTSEEYKNKQYELASWLIKQNIFKNLEDVIDYFLVQTESNSNIQESIQVNFKKENINGYDALISTDNKTFNDYVYLFDKRIASIISHSKLEEPATSEDPSSYNQILYYYIMSPNELISILPQLGANNKLLTQFTPDSINRKEEKDEYIFKAIKNIFKKSKREDPCVSYTKTDGNFVKMINYYNELNSLTKNLYLFVTNSNGAVNENLVDYKKYPNIFSILPTLSKQSLQEIQNFNDKDFNDNIDLPYYAECKLDKNYLTNKVIELNINFFYLIKFWNEHFNAANTILNELQSFYETVNKNGSLTLNIKPFVKRNTEEGKDTYYPYTIFKSYYFKYELAQ